jgi:single-strand DNA-binding protein
MQISGRLTRDPEIKDGKYQIAKFSLAVRQNRKNDQGDYGVDYVNCTVFGKRAATIQQHYHKSNLVTVAGEWSLNTWTGRDNREHTQLQLDVNDFDLPEFRNEPTQKQAAPKNDPFANSGDAIDISDDDLPF